jgi:hypothetical protein
MIHPVERLRAFAELSSTQEDATQSRRADNTEPGYVARQKLESQDALDNNSRNYRGGHRSNTGHSRTYRGDYRNNTGHSSTYHPYQRPSQAQQPFRNTSGTPSNQPSIGETPQGTLAAALTPDSTPPAQGSQERAGLQLKLCTTFTYTGIQRDYELGSTFDLDVTNYCVGFCKRQGCWYHHDVNKLAVCRRWLFKGECPKGTSCLLSHELSPHNTPTCQHFQDGLCTNDPCRFSHIRINPAALNCISFGSMGYCEKGTRCTELHALECPYLANNGACLYGDRCRLGHVYRSSRMRKSALSSSDERSSSEDPLQEGSSDATGTETWTGGVAQDPHQFTQQADFVALNTDE